MRRPQPPHNAHLPPSVLTSYTTHTTRGYLTPTVYFNYTAPTTQGRLIPCVYISYTTNKTQEHSMLVCISVTLLTQHKDTQVTMATQHADTPSIYTSNTATTTHGHLTRIVYISCNAYNPKRHLPQRVNTSYTAQTMQGHLTASVCISYSVDVTEINLTQTVSTSYFPLGRQGQQPQTLQKFGPQSYGAASQCFVGQQQTKPLKSITSSDNQYEIACKPSLKKHVGKSSTESTWIIITSYGGDYVGEYFSSL